MDALNRLLAQLSPEHLLSLSAGGVRLLLILAIAFTITRVVGRVLAGLRHPLIEGMHRHAGGDSSEIDKRAATLIGIITRAVSTVVWGLAVVMALRELGFDIGPVLASAGVLGLAVGFGAQNLVRDVIAGLFMLLENQIRVNDVAVINGTGGLVEEVNLRTTVLRSLDGTVHVFPNGQINTLSNMTREFSFYVFDMGVAYKEDTDRVVEVMREVADELMANEAFRPFILEPLEILGVDAFADSAVVIKARIKTVPVKQWAVGRELNRRFKKRFDEVGIEIPFPQRTLHFGETSPPFKIEAGGTDPQAREALKALIRETVDEMQAGTPSLGEGRLPGPRATRSDT
jgi:small conductance mechanosensitive channel